MRGNPKHLTQIFEASHSIRVVGQNCIIGRESEGSYFNDPIPIFGNWLIPHMAASAGANAGTQVVGIRLDLKAFPIRSVFLKPIFGLKGKAIEIFKMRGDDDALGSIEFKIGKEGRFIKDRFDKFQKLVAAKRSPNIARTPPKRAMRRFPIGRQ